MVAIGGNVKTMSWFPVSQMVANGNLAIIKTIIAEPCCSTNNKANSRSSNINFC